MDQLKEAFEAVEMLEALGLPVSKEQLDNLNKLKREYLSQQIVKRNTLLPSFNYRKCYDQYTKCINNLRQAKIKGEVIVAKPVLLLALIEGVHQEVFQDNKFVLNEWLEEKYLELMKIYTLNSQFEKPADIANPFWHLSSDGFWHLHCKEEKIMKTTPSKRWLKDNVSYASFDEDLWVLLMNISWRIKFQNFISKNKLTNI